MNKANGHEEWKGPQANCFSGSNSDMNFSLSVVDKSIKIYLIVKA